MTKPTETPPARRPLPVPAGDELRVRFRAKAEAERALVDFLGGVALALGIDPARVVGYDDDTHDLLLTPEAADADTE